MYSAYITWEHFLASRPCTDWYHKLDLRGNQVVVQQVIDIDQAHVANPRVFQEDVHRLDWLLLHTFWYVHQIPICIGWSSHLSFHLCCPASNQSNAFVLHRPFLEIYMPFGLYHVHQTQRCKKYSPFLLNISKLVPCCREAKSAEGRL